MQGSAASRPPVRVAVDLGASALVVLVLWMTVPAGGAVLLTWQVALAAAAAGGMLLRHRWPRAAFAVAASATAAAWYAGLTGDPFVLAAVALHSAARSSDRPGSARTAAVVAVAAGVVLGLLALVAAPAFEEAIRGALLSLVVLVGAAAAGVASRRAERLAVENGVLAERARIGRDVHDVLSHSLGAIGVRAGVAAHVTTLDAAALRSTLAEVERTARSGVAELGLLLAATRAGPDELIPDGALPARLRETVAAAEAAGISVTLDVEGVDVLRGQERVAVHHVVREAVTNVIRHAGAARCDIAVHADDDAVRVSVVDDGVGRAPLSEGDGLRGLRERVAILGGGLAVRDAEGSGVRVDAVIPRPAAPNGSGSRS
ncbi:sensor histidine kinase [Clavibacter michiganensis]|uniref:sensor histidine kinase n=1 Tax=Clavibacter michiganensis TaxID=28447 RepID=UPI003EB81DFD